MSASLSGVFNLQEFTDLGGLAAGFRLYTYAPSTTTQKVAYTDAAGTIPHTYTSDGVGGQYLALNSRGELPAPLFLSPGGYDLTLKTAAGVTVWTRRAIGGGDDLRADLASTSASKGSALVGFLQDGSGAVARTSLAKMREAVSVKDFGAVGNGVADDTAAISIAINYVRTYGGTLFFPPGIYQVTSFTVPSGPVVNLVGQGEQTIIRTTSATANVITIAAWYSTVEKIKFLSSAPRTAGAYVVLSGAHTRAIGCHFDGDFNGVKMSGVGCKIQFNTFSNGVSGARRIWATGGDTSQTIQGNLFNAQASGIVSAGVFVDDSSALKLIDNDIIGQGRCLHIAPASGQAVFSLWSTGNFFDTADFGVAIEPSGTGAVRRVSFSDDWASSHTNSGMLLSASGSAVIDGVDIDGCETSINAQNGIALAGAGVINVRIRNVIARQNNAGVSIGANVQKWFIDGMRAEAADGLTANAYGVFINAGADNYQITNSDLSGQTTASISGHTTGTATRIIQNVAGYVTVSQGIATIATGNTTVVVPHGLAGTPNRVFLTPHSDVAGRFWTQQSSWGATNFTISQNGSLGFAAAYSWRAEL